MAKTEIIGIAAILAAVYFLYSKVSSDVKDIVPSLSSFNLSNIFGSDKPPEAARVINFYQTPGKEIPDVLPGQPVMLSQESQAAFKDPFGNMQSNLYVRGSSVQDFSEYTAFRPYYREDPQAFVNDLRRSLLPGQGVLINNFESSPTGSRAIKDPGYTGRISIIPSRGSSGSGSSTGGITIPSKIIEQNKKNDQKINDPGYTGRIGIFR